MSLAISVIDFMYNVFIRPVKIFVEYGGNHSRKKLHFSLMNDRKLTDLKTIMSLPDQGQSYMDIPAMSNRFERTTE